VAFELEACKEFIQKNTSFWGGSYPYLLTIFSNKVV
jgi:hypothetical protein